MWIDFPGSRCYKMFYILFKQIVFRENYYGFINDRF